MSSSAEHQRRRKQLLRLMPEGSAAIVPAAPKRVRSQDAYYPYRQDSDLIYLSGFAEPDAVLVLLPGRKAGESILFCRERERERERWDGEIIGPERAPATLKVDDAFPIEDIDDILPNLLDHRRLVYYHFGRDPEFDLTVLGWINRLRAQAHRGARAPESIVALGYLLNEMRLIKSPAELKLLRQAAAISGSAHRQLMQRCKPGLSEREIEADLLHSFHTQGAVAAYEPMVASGRNACTLHYRAHSSRLKAGELLLVDAGAEVQCYASDITRTIPVSGRFTPAQRALYEVVLQAQNAAIAASVVGQVWDAVHEAALHAMIEGLLSLKLLKGRVSDIKRHGRYKKYFMHKTGHWLGLDVHDVGDYRIDGSSRLLEPGMVFTVEPGLYIAPDDQDAPLEWRGVGIRIEDEILVRAQGPEILTAHVPRDPESIEALMAQATSARHSFA
jgi:Xaa-Pro aminopeptidase